MHVYAAFRRNSLTTCSCLFPVIIRLLPCWCISAVVMLGLVLVFGSPLYSSVTPSLFHSRLKTYLFHRSYPSSFTSAGLYPYGLLLRPSCLSYSVFVFSFTYFSFLCRALDQAGHLVFLAHANLQYIIIIIIITRQGGYYGFYIVSYLISIVLRDGLGRTPLMTCFCMEWDLKTLSRSVCNNINLYDSACFEPLHAKIR